MLRYSGNNFEVFDGYSWVTINAHSSIGMTQDAHEAIQWVRRKMREEAKIQTAIDKFPALKQAKENYELIKQLVMSEIDNSDTDN